MIDFHTHQPRRTTSGELPYSSDDYVGFMDDLGVDQSVVFTYDGLRRPSRAANESLADFVSRAAGRCVAFATIDPMDPQAARDFERCVVELGMRGLKLHPWLQGFCPYRPFMDPICETAAMLSVPIFFHDGTPPFSAPLQIALLARRHPRTTFILGHGGLHDMWREAIAAVASCDNLYLCMCASPMYAMRAIVARCRMDRLLFGSDAGVDMTCRSHYVQLRFRQLERVGLSASAFHAISELNPARLLSGTT